MADFDYSGDGAALGESMKDWLSPLDAAGIDPDEARANQAEALAKVQAGGYEEGEDPNGEGGGQQQETPRPSPGLIRRAQPEAAPQPDAAAVAPAGAAAPAPDPFAAPDDSYNTGGGGAPAPAAAQTPTWADYARRGMTGLADNMNDATAAAKKLAASPDLATVNAPAQAEFQKYSQPLNPNDYKPSVGSRILRGLEGTAAGVLRGGVIGGVVGAIDPSKTAGGGHGYSDPNADYARKTAMRAQIAKSDVDQMAQNKTAFDAATAREKELSAAQAGAGTMAHNLATAATGQQNADSTAFRDQNDTPAAKAAAALQTSTDTYNQRRLRISDRTSPLGRLPDASKAYYLATGKAPDPRQATAEEVLFGRAYSAESAQHPPGWKPTLSDIRNIASAAKGTDPEARGGRGGSKAIPAGTAARISDEKNNAMQIATTALNQGRDKGMQPYKKEDWLRDMQAAQNKFEEAIDAAGGESNHMTIGPDGAWNSAATESAAAGPGPAPGPAAPLVPGRPGIPARTVAPRPTPQTHPPGTYINVAGKQRLITGYNPKTGKPIVAQ